MPKILNFPDPNHPASFKNLKGLVKAYHVLDANEQEHYKALDNFIERTTKVDKSLDPKLKQTKKLIKECIDVYKDRAKELKDLLKKLNE